jgi:hypothetical protein
MSSAFYRWRVIATRGAASMLPPCTLLPLRSQFLGVQACSSVPPRDPSASLRATCAPSASSRWGSEPVRTPSSQAPLVPYGSGLQLSPYSDRCSPCACRRRRLFHLWPGGRRLLRLYCSAWELVAELGVLLPAELGVLPLSEDGCVSCCSYAARVYAAVSTAAVPRGSASQQRNTE